MNISRRHDSLNILLEFTQEMKEVWATVGVALWQKFNSQFRPIFSYDIDFCETLKRIKTSKIQIVNIWIGNFWKYGNMSTTCPFGTVGHFLCFKGNFVIKSICFADSIFLQEFQIRQGEHTIVFALG